MIGLTCLDMDTPDGVAYKTPGAITNAAAAEDEHEELETEAMDIVSVSSSNDWESDDEAESEIPSLTWNGRTVLDIKLLFEAANVSNRQGEVAAAETMFEAAVEGYQYLLGPAHDTTNTAVMALATFYIEHDRMPDAYRVMEECFRRHIEQFGVDDKRTSQYVMNIVELLNGSNKQDDAMALLERAQSLLQSHQNRQSSPKTRARRMSKGNRKQRAEPNAGPTFNLEQTLRSIAGGELEYGLNVANVQVQSRNAAIEEVLRAIIKQCGSDTDKLAIERLQAWAQLLRLYEKLGTLHANSAQFEAAKAALNSILVDYRWALPTRQKFKSLRLMEVSLEVSAAFLKAGRFDASLLFRKCHEKAVDVFGWDDERTIWILISIGLVYQGHSGWKDAQSWFESALASASQRYDEDDGIRISLEEALQVGHFSYVNDEGRPYKTIFGVNGLTVRPNRLHIE